jgi:hypothetical protein
VIWPFKAQSPSVPTFSIGPYKVDMMVGELRGLFPLSVEELVALNTAVQFEGEQIWHAPEADFMDHKWDTILGTVNGRIYEIAIQRTGPRHQTGQAYREILTHCTRLYGRGKNSMLWDASDGNIVLDSANSGDQGILNVFVTSQKVRQFKRA